MNRKILISFLIFCALGALGALSGLASSTALIPVANAQATETTEKTIEIIPEDQRQEFSAKMFAIPNEFMNAKVMKVTERDDTQKVQLIITGGEEKGKIINVIHGDVFSLREDLKVHEGEEVIIGRAEATDHTGKTEIIYSITEKNRLPSVIIIVLIFFGLVILFGRMRGFTAILGLILSFAILIKLIIPGILAGWDPFLVTLAGSFLIAVISIYLAHGFYKRTSIAVISTLITLVIAVILGVIFVEFAKLSGYGSEDAYLLQMGFIQNINLKGLLLGGIIIGALGVLDDVTMAQAAAIEEIHKANPKLKFEELYKRGISIGKEHISSMVNTLVLAYAGAAFPLFIIFSMDTGEPLWVTLNHEYIVEEIIRALVGSTALIFAVPIATLLAARTYSKQHA